MTNWWTINLSVVGPISLINELVEALPTLTIEQIELYPTLPESVAVSHGMTQGGPLFHDVRVTSNAAGFAALQCSRNYGGMPACEELVARFPDLRFQGVVTNDYSDTYLVFDGRGGAITVEEYELDDCRLDDKSEIAV